MIMSTGCRQPLICVSFSASKNDPPLFVIEREFGITKKRGILHIKIIKLAKWHMKGTDGIIEYVVKMKIIIIFVIIK